MWILRRKHEIHCLNVRWIFQVYGVSASARFDKLESWQSYSAKLSNFILKQLSPYPSHNFSRSSSTNPAAFRRPNQLHHGDGDHNTPPASYEDVQWIQQGGDCGGPDLWSTMHPAVAQYDKITPMPFVERRNQYLALISRNHPLHLHYLILVVIIRFYGYWTYFIYNLWNNNTKTILKNFIWSQSVS